jgi:glycosyltransferase involved in cell wall biosynthesis
MPVRNEARYIERCLYSLAAQDYPRDKFEVLVIDGQSTDHTKQAVTRFASESTVDVRLLQNPRLLPAPALNIGLAEARGDVIVRIDGHAAVAPDFLRSSVEALWQTRADCVGGVIESEGDTPLGETIALAMSSRFGVGGAAFRIGGEGPADTVAFGAYRREVFDRIGNFTEDIDKGEDDEFNYRLLDAGGTIMLMPQIRSRYTVRDDLPGLFRQYFGYGKAKPQVLARHPLQARPRQFAAPLLVVGLAGASLLAILGWKSPLKSLLRMYTLSATTASLVLAGQHGWRHLPVLPPIFACLHLAYGLGFVAGVMGLTGKTLGQTSDAPGAHQSTEASA